LLLVYGGGRAYTVTETLAALGSAGFRDCRHVPMSLLNVNGLVVGFA
jgi:hypothetical protein